MILYSPEMENFNKDVKTGVVGYGTMFFAFQKALEDLGHELKMTTGDVYLHFIPPEHAKGASIK